MPDEKTSYIVRLRDGSIDYQYYAAKGSMARNMEMKIVVGKVLGASQMTAHVSPVLLTAILLVLIL